MTVETPRSPKPQMIQIPADIPLQVTPDQFVVIAAANRDLRLERTAIGKLIVNPPTGSESSYRNLSISTQLGIWLEAHESLGIAFDSSGGFQLPNGAIRSPDAAWIQRDRWERLTPQERAGFAPLCPDFVVELRSKSDNLQDLQDKLQEYMDNGCQLGWLIDPQRRRVEIYRAEQPVEVLEQPNTLSGESILPGFTLSLTRIWA